MTRDPITQKKDSIQRYFNAISMVFDWYFHGISMVFTSYSTNLLGVSWGCSGGISDWMYVYIYIQLYDVICTTILYDHRYSAYANYYGYAQL